LENVQNEVMAKNITITHNQWKCEGVIGLKLLELWSL